VLIEFVFSKNSYGQKKNFFPYCIRKLQKGHKTFLQNLIALIARVTRYHKALIYNFRLLGLYMLDYMKTCEIRD